MQIETYIGGFKSNTHFVNVERNEIVYKVFFMTLV